MRALTPRRAAQDRPKTVSPDAAVLPTQPDPPEQLQDEVHRLERLLRSQAELIARLQGEAEKCAEAATWPRELEPEVTPDHHMAFSRFLCADSVAEITAPMALNEYTVWLGKKYALATWKEKARDLAPQIEVPEEITRREIVSSLWNVFKRQVRAGV